MSAYHEKQYSIVDIAMNLFFACIISGLILAGTYYLTAPIAAQKAEDMKNDAMKTLVKEADSFVPVKDKKDWFEAQKGGQTIAYVVPGESKGYGGEIKMLVAVSLDGKVIDYDILKHNETPGLGDNANKDPFKSNVLGKGTEGLEVTKDPAKQNLVQSITGATISSKAVVKGIREAVETVQEYSEGK
jgi:electron transport complex protein RnfG